MGFNYINDEQKIRFSLSKQAYTVINEDMRIFSIAKQTSIINLIITNFRESAKASISKHRLKVREQYEKILKDSTLEETSKRIAVDHMVQKEQEENSELLQKYLKNKYHSKLYHINVSNCNYLINECSDQEFYKERPGAYIKCIIEEYSSLPFIERERIIKREVYDTIEYASKMNFLLQVNVKSDSENRKFITYPYKIMSDPLNTQEYLACYTRLPEQSSKEKHVASFSMARLERPIVLKQKSFLSKDDIKKIEDAVSKNSVAFLLGDLREIHVSLTERGKQSYQIKLYSRPDKDEALSSDDEYVFFCSEQQAYYYFFPFGADAEIISPLSLRARMKKDYQNALNSYK